MFFIIKLFLNIFLSQYVFYLRGNAAPQFGFFAPAASTYGSPSKSSLFGQPSTAGMSATPAVNPFGGLAMTNPSIPYATISPFQMNSLGTSSAPINEVSPTVSSFFGSPSATVSSLNSMFPSMTSSFGSSSVAATNSMSSPPTTYPFGTINSNPQTAINSYGNMVKPALTNTKSVVPTNTNMQPNMQAISQQPVVQMSAQNISDRGETASYQNSSVPFLPTEFNETTALTEPPPPDQWNINMAKKKSRIPVELRNYTYGVDDQFGNSYDDTYARPYGQELTPDMNPPELHYEDPLAPDDVYDIC